MGFTSLEEIRQTLSRDLIKQLALPDIEERAEIAAQAFRMFQRMQTVEGMDSGDFAAAKATLRERLDELRGEDRGHLALVEGGTSSIPDVAATAEKADLKQGSCTEV